MAQVGRRRLESCDWRRPFVAHLESGRQRLDVLHRHADSLSPQHVIERGFAVVRRADGAVVRGPDDVSAGDKLTVRVARGTAISVTVDDTGPGRR